MARHGLGPIVLALVASALMTGTARAQTYVQGIGGVGFGTWGSDVLIGVGAGVTLTPNIQAITGVAYMRNTRTDLLDGLGDPFLGGAGRDVRLSTLYGEGGVRFLSAPLPIRGYLETTAGVARLRASLDSNRGGAAIDEALGYYNTTQPLLGVGAGVLLDAGPAVIDLGYRFKRIYTEEPLDLNQFYTAVGFWF